MVKIRLTRIGRKNLPFYRVVAMESSTKRDGRPISFLGTYDPVSKNTNLKSDDIRRFIANGAQPTKTVESLLTKAGIIVSEATK
jgi:small subunit ribosomal protein S16